MKRLSLLILTFFSLFLFSACRKDLLHWQTVEHIPNGGITQWNTAQFLPNGIGIIGGGQRFDSAQVLVSTDGGASWSARAMPNDSKGFFGSCVSPGGKIYFCCLGLNICSSSDGMLHYDYNRIPGPYEFTSAVSFGDADHGVAVTNLGTDSGGVVLFDASLHLTSFRRFNNALNDVKMFDAQRGIAVGSGIVMKTTDGGQNWTRLAATGDNFYRIAALDSNRIFVCGLSGYILKTNDAGANWKRLRNGGDITLPNYQLWDITFKDEQNGYAVGEHGLVIYTDDGGDHWMEYDHFTHDNLRFIRICPDGKLLIGGENGSLYRLQVK